MACRISIEGSDRAGTQTRLLGLKPGSNVQRCLSLWTELTGNRERELNFKHSGKRLGDRNKLTLSCTVW